ncbi:hypothetical protein EON80_18525 [bacterium]|nr:MAG: hypothetical protein EON80_18525 [bacterium]
MKKALPPAAKWLLLLPLIVIPIATARILRSRQKSPVKAIEILAPSFPVSFSFSPDSKRLVVLTSGSKNPLNTGYIYDVQTRKPLCGLIRPTTTVPPSLGGVSFTAPREPADAIPHWSPDGNRIVSGYTDGTKGTTRTKVPLPPGTQGSVFFTNSVGKFAVWNARNGALQGQHLYAPLKEESGGGVAFSTDGKQLIGYGRPLSRFDAKTGQRLEVLKFGPAPGYTSAFNEKLGLFAVTSSKEKRVQVIDIKTKRVLWNWQGHDVTNLVWGNEILAVVSNEGKTVQTAPDTSHLLLWDSRTRKLLTSPAPKVKTTIGEVGFKGDGRTLFYNTYDDINGFHFMHGVITVWDYRQNRVLWNYKNTSRLYWPQWSPDGKWVSATIGSSGSSFNTGAGGQGQLLIFDGAGQLHQQVETTREFYAWSPDSRSVATTLSGENQSSSIRITDLNDKP